MAKQVHIPAYEPYPKSAPIPPILSGVQFAHATNEDGGATQSLRTGRMLAPGEHGYIVGGEPDDHGNRIPTHYHEGLMSPLDAINHRSRLRQQTHALGASLGSWRDKGKVEIDASRVEPSRAVAVRAAKTRGEKAIWDNKRGKEVRTS